MQIEKIEVINEGYVKCSSCFYTSHDILSNDLKYCFYTGVNKLYGEIDSGVWAISYLLSMYSYRSEDFILFRQPEIIINNTTTSLDNIFQYSCYMDKLYPLFSTNDTVQKLIEKGIEDNNLNYSTNEIRELFKLTLDRFDRPLFAVGNEMFKAMAAIGFCYKKQVFCFPWMSKKRFDSYHKNIIDLLEVLASLEKIIILPLGVYENI